MSAEYAYLTTDDLVTGEAVALDLPPAGLGIRMVSGLIDVVATVVLLFAFGLLFMVASISADQALQTVAILSLTITVFVVVPTTLETTTRGRSLGKLALGLRTVRDDGGPITFQQAFIRSLVGFVEIYSLSGVPAFFSALLSPRAKRLGDYAAGTHVVRERVRLALSQPVPMPRPLAGWAGTADIAPLPPRLALAIRQYLARTHDISAQSREMLANRLAAQLASYVAPPPPPGTPADAFLAAVMASRRERDSKRLQRDEQLRQRLVRPADRRSR